MLNLSNIKPKKQKKTRKRVGRGSGSGQGTYSGRGMKGQKSRSGGNIKPGFEGGRTPFIRQIPKRRGFKSPHPDAQVVNLKDLEAACNAGEMLTPKQLVKKGLAENIKKPIKILGNGTLNKKIIVKNILVSQKARQAIEKAGGQVEAGTETETKEKKTEK